MAQQPGSAVSAAVLAANPRRVKSGRLVVKVAGVPKGAKARVVVKGPAGYSKVKRTVRGFRLKGLRPGRYRVQARQVTTPTAQYQAPTTVVRVKRGKPARVRVRYQRTVLISKKTEVLTRSESGRLRAARPGELVFTGTRVPATVGEVVVSGPTRVAPQGLLRKVVRVSRRDGATVLTTKPAVLTDVIREASIDVSGVRLDPAGTTRVSTSGAPAASFTPNWYGEGRVGAPVSLSKSWTASNSGVGVSADVSVQSGQSVDIALDIKRRGLTPALTYFSTKVTLAQEIKATIGASAGGAASVSKRLPSVRIGQVTVPVGPVPVVFTFRLDPELRAGVGFGRKATASLNGKATRIAEVFYRDGQWGGASTSSWESGGNVTTGQWSGYVRGGLQADVAMSLYDLAGPIIGAETGLRAKATPDKPDLCSGKWELLGQGRADIGGKVSLFGVKDVALTIPIAQKDWRIKTGTWTTKSCQQPPPATSAGTIAFTVVRDIPEIYRMNADGSGRTRLTNNPGYARGNSSPSFSRDGRHIVFASSRDDDFEIYRMNADGSGQTRLTTSLGIDYYPAFSADGRLITFVSSRSGDEEIYRMNADGSGQTRLTTSPGLDRLPAFSPDARHIVFVSDRSGDGIQIYRMNADGSNQTRLTTGPRWNSQPSYSPDGRYIVFRSNRGPDDVGIYRMNADGSNQIRLTSTPGDTPVYSPDGRYIAFASRRGGDGNVEIYRMDADGSRPINLTNSTDHEGEPTWGGR